MCKSEIFAKILRIVSKETEVSEDLLPICARLIFLAPPFPMINMLLYT